MERLFHVNGKKLLFYNSSFLILNKILYRLKKKVAYIRHKKCTKFYRKRGPSLQRGEGMKNKIVILLGIICFLWVEVKFVYAFPTLLADQYYGGHEYEIMMSPGISWTNANSNISGSWYLATITSQNEQNFIESLIYSAQLKAQYLYGCYIKGLWLGGNFTSSGQKVWVNGETWNYENWGTNQPSHHGYIAISAYNNCGGGCCGGHCCSNLSLGEWYIPSSCSCGCSCCRICGYIQERPAPVPEPTTLFLIGSGILGVLGCRKKRLS